jgi:uncharacterized metal-binding protein YceD (DUF177 family)
MPEEIWSVPVRLTEIPDAGRRYEIEADEPTRKAVARAANLLALPRLTASFEVVHDGKGLAVSGQVSATVQQSCVVTLEPVTNEVAEPVDLRFLPEDGTPARAGLADSGEAGADAEDAPEPLINGRVDLGALAVEFLILGLDPYPRRPGTVFAPPEDDAEAHPFAALAALQKKPGASEG